MAEINKEGFVSKKPDTEPGGSGQKPVPQNFLQKCVGRLKKTLRIVFLSTPSKDQKRG